MLNPTQDNKEANRLATLTYKALVFDSLMVRLNEEDEKKMLTLLENLYLQGKANGLSEALSIWRG